LQKLAIIVTHPIQYYAPLFSLLHKRDKIQVKVFYTWERGSESFDRGFGKKVAWDIPLLEGYEYQYVSNNKNMKRGFWQVRNPTLNAEIREWNANAVLVFGWNYWSHLKALMYFKGRIPVLFRGDSHLLDKKSSWKNLLRKTWLSWVYRHIDYGLYVGTNNKNYYLEYGLKEEQLVFAPHAVDNDRFYDNCNRLYEDKALDWRKELGFKEEDTVFMFIGKLEEKKDPFLLLNAFKKLTRADIRLLFVGNGPLEKQLKEQALEDLRIKFIDFQNQAVVPVIYRIADVVILPSKGPGETWGLAINEAMACGRPVLVSDKVGCGIDLVRSGQNGYVFESKNQNDLIIKMECLFEQKRNRLMGISAQKLINNWSLIALAERLEKHLESLDR